MPDFHTAGRVLSNKLLGSCYMFFVLSLVQHIKVFFYQKGKGISFFVFHLMFFYEHVNICIVYITVSKTVIFYVEFTKKVILFSLFTSRFFIPNKHHMHCGTFFERGSNSLKQTYIERGYMSNEQERTRGRGSKTGNFKWTYFLNDPIEFEYSNYWESTVFMNFHNFFKC